MADVKLSPRRTAGILGKLDEGMRSVAAARDEVIQAMADRRVPKPKTKRHAARSTRKA